MFEIYKITFRRLVREPFYWLLLLSSVLACEIAPAFSDLFSFGKMEFASMDIVQATVFMALLAYVVRGSMVVLGRDLGERNDLILFSRPISRRTILIARFLAIYSALSCISLLLGIWLIKQGWYLNWGYKTFSLALCCAWNAWLQASVLLSLLVALAAMTETLYAILIVLAAYMFSYCIPSDYSALTCWLLPPFQWYDLGPVIYSGGSVGWVYMTLLTAYSMLYSAFILTLGGMALERREF
ncbi:MAG: hypothetical protein HQL31_01155 [Planctomycetes bacterium]|nr:hypothetical protein [Planctomycetota bacterium]